MIQDRKIDLALEAKELAEGSAAQTTRLAGVKAQEDTVFGYPLTRVEILNREGEAALGKPKGTYLTLELPQLPREREEVLRAARGVAAVLEALPTLPKQGSVLVAGLGNRRVTPDAIGPRATDFLLVTRHLVQTMPQDFSALRPAAQIPQNLPVIIGVGLAVADVLIGGVPCKGLRGQPRPADAALRGHRRKDGIGGQGHPMAGGLAGLHCGPGFWGKAAESLGLLKLLPVKGVKQGDVLPDLLPIQGGESIPEGRLIGAFAIVAHHGGGAGPDIVHQSGRVIPVGGQLLGQEFEIPTGKGVLVHGEQGPVQVE